MWTEVLIYVRIVVGLFAYIKHWMEKFRNYLLVNYFRFSDFWNMDETGVQASGIHCKKVIVC